MVLMPVKDEIREVLRVTILGPNFPQRAIQPEIVANEQLAEGVSVSRDQKSIRGYFMQIPEEGARIRVRYGDSQEGVLREPFLRKSIRPLPKECD